MGRGYIDCSYCGGKGTAAVAGTGGCTGCDIWQCCRCTRRWIPDADQLARDAYFSLDHASQTRARAQHYRDLALLEATQKEEPRNPREPGVLDLRNHNAIVDAKNTELDQLRRERDELREQLITADVSFLKTAARAEQAEKQRDEAARLLRSAQEFADEAFDHWDGDRDMKAGKMLLALAGKRPGYRKETDAISDFLATLKGSGEG